MSDKIQENFMLGCYIKILQDNNIEKDVKWSCIMRMLHEEMISLHKAFELCESYGLTKSSYLEIEERFMKAWNNLMDK